MFLRFNVITQGNMFTLWRPIGHWPCLMWIFWLWFPHYTRWVTAPLWCTFRTAGCCLPGLVQQIVVLLGEVKSFSYSLFSLLCYCRQPLVWRCRHVDWALKAGATFCTLNACPRRCSFLPPTRPIWDWGLHGDYWDHGILERVDLQLIREVLIYQSS
jgi:hypothetical protein